MSEKIKHIIRNNWKQSNGRPFSKAQILENGINPDGLIVSRLSFSANGSEIPDPSVGHIISVIKGRGKLVQINEQNRSLQLNEGVHLYLPPNQKHLLTVEAGTELVKVSCSSASQARGDQLLLRDETFLYASASKKQSLRWILTPQYLSRRIFLHNDKTLLSRSGNPVSWFRTTMFDVTGLPVNEDNESVFKMIYKSRTEFNVCYDVKGKARVRFACHPYRDVKQDWEPWQPLDSETTYLVNESEDRLEIERVVNDKGEVQCLRNKHEVHIEDGYVTLFCLFDPAPTGVERHLPGTYSDYEPLTKLIGSRIYEEHQKEITKYDYMLDTLSLAKAKNQLNEYKNKDIWELYLNGREVQHSIEVKLLKTLRSGGSNRDHVVRPWTINPYAANV